VDSEDIVLEMRLLAEQQTGLIRGFVVPAIAMRQLVGPQIEF
jgi:hypothetical protein